MADGSFADGTSYKTTFMIITWFDTQITTCDIRFYGLQVELGSETSDSFTVNFTGGGSYYIQQAFADPAYDRGIRDRRL